MYLEQIVVGQMAVFAYIIGCPETKKAVLIDPAGNEETLVARVKEQGFELQSILNTHAHADHTCGNKKIKESTGAEIIVGEKDLDLMTGDRAKFWESMGFTPSPLPDRTVNDGDTINVGEIIINCRATPGHSPGGMCYYINSEPGHIFTGDSLFVGAIGRTDLPGGSLQILMNSIKEKILTLPDETVVWPGHNYGSSPSSTVGMEKKTNPYVLEYT